VLHERLIPLDLVSRCRLQRVKPPSSNLVLANLYSDTVDLCSSRRVRGHVSYTYRPVTIGTETQVVQLSIVNVLVFLKSKKRKCQKIQRTLTASCLVLHFCFPLGLSQKEKNIGMAAPLFLLYEWNAGNISSLIL